MTDDLKELLTDVAERQVLRKAQRRKAAAQALIQNPDILESLASDLTETIETTPLPELSSDSESHWTSRLHPDWTEKKLKGLDSLETKYLRKAPGLSPEDLEEIAQTT